MPTELAISPMEWLRQRHKFTKRYVADFLKMSAAAYGRMEKGMFNVSVEHQKALCRLYDVSLDFFNTEAPVVEWEKMLQETKYNLGDPGETYSKSATITSPHMNSNHSTEEDIFLANLTIEQLRKEIALKNETIELMKARYLDTVKQNEALKDALKKNSPS